MHEPLPVRWPPLTRPSLAGQPPETEGPSPQEAYEEGFRRGYEDGYRAGWESGLSEARARAGEELSTVRAALEEGYREAMRQVEGLAVELALKVASRIIGRVVEEHPDLVQAAVRAAEEEARQFGEPRVFAHPDLAERIGAEPDPSLPPGGIEVRTEAGGWDLSLFGRLHLLRRWLAGGGSSLAA